MVGELGIATQNLKVQLKHIGPLDEAEFEVAPLTVICGPNNTGKTYATYALYGFLRSWRMMLSMHLRERLGEELATTGVKQLDLVEMFEGKINETLAYLSDEYVAQLPRVFAARPERFADAVVRVEIDEQALAGRILASSFERPIRLDDDGQAAIVITKAAGQPNLEVLVNNIEGLGRHSPLRFFEAETVAEIVFAPVMPRTFIASAERTGAAIFLRELDFARTQLLEELGAEEDEHRNLSRLLRRYRVDYPSPVSDNIEFIRRIDIHDKFISRWARAHPDLLDSFEDIIGGSYRVDENLGLQYQPRDTDLRLSMKESSSSIRALVDIGFYLRSQAKPGDLLMIDEPELNLHPANQRRLARLLVRLVNAGIRVFLTTHSDYLVNEFNTLIMLNSGSPAARRVQSRYGYLDSELLDPEKVRLYMTEPPVLPAEGTEAGPRTLHRADIDPEQGIEVQSFDRTIDEMNEIQTALLFGGDA